MTTPTPAVIARIDQDRARLADLVDQVRRHQQGCDRPRVCPGRHVANTIYDLGCDDLEALLTTAVLELAATTYRTTNQKG